MTFPELKEQLKDKEEEHDRDQAEIEGKLSLRMLMLLQQEMKAEHCLTL